MGRGRRPERLQRTPTPEVVAPRFLASAFQSVDNSDSEIEQTFRPYPLGVQIVGSQVADRCRDRPQNAPTCPRYIRIVTEPEAYTLILTEGVHIVSTRDAEIICRAIEGGEKIVEVDVQLFAGSDSVRRTRVVTAHVIALSQVDRPQRTVVADAGAKVTPLWDRR
jgi:hypothetical protein